MNVQGPLLDLSTLRFLLKRHQWPVLYLSIAFVIQFSAIFYFIKMNFQHKWKFVELSVQTYILYVQLLVSACALYWFTRHQFCQLSGLAFCRIVYLYHSLICPLIESSGESGEFSASRIPGLITLINPLVIIIHSSVKVFALLSDSNGGNEIKIFRQSTEFV